MGLQRLAFNKHSCDHGSIRTALLMAFDVLVRRTGQASSLLSFDKGEIALEILERWQQTATQHLKVANTTSLSQTRAHDRAGMICHCHYFWVVTGIRFSLEESFLDFEAWTRLLVGCARICMCDFCEQVLNLLMLCLLHLQLPNRLDLPDSVRNRLPCSASWAFQSSRLLSVHMPEAKSMYCIAFNFTQTCWLLFRKRS